MKIRKLNHVVLYVNDIYAVSKFYEDVLGLKVADRIGDEAVFLKVPEGNNHHELGLIKVDQVRGDGTLMPGLYHTAWEVDTFEEFADARTSMANCGLLLGESEHGTSLSLYAKDPEGNEFEICWILPRDVWEQRGFGIRPLEFESEADEWRVTSVGEFEPG